MRRRRATAVGDFGAEVPVSVSAFRRENRPGFSWRRRAGGGSSSERHGLFLGPAAQESRPRALPREAERTTVRLVRRPFEQSEPLPKIAVDELPPQQQSRSLEGSIATSGAGKNRKAHFDLSAAAADLGDTVCRPPKQPKARMLQAPWTRTFPVPQLPSSAIARIRQFNRAPQFFPVRSGRIRRRAGRLGQGAIRSPRRNCT